MSIFLPFGTLRHLSRTCLTVLVQDSSVKIKMNQTAGCRLPGGWLQLKIINNETDNEIKMKHKKPPTKKGRNHATGSGQLELQENKFAKV